MTDLSLTFLRKWISRKKENQLAGRLCSLSGFSVGSYQVQPFYHMHPPFSVIIAKEPHLKTESGRGGDRRGSQRSKTKGSSRGQETV